MARGIQVCGLNGCGKSTLGRALAQKIGFHFIDNEELFFTRNAADEPYQNPRSRAEVEKILMEEVRKHGDFVLAAVRGNYGKEILPLYRYTVLMEVPKEIRMERIRNRSFQKFGSRMREGGELYEQEEAFFRTAASRPEDYAAAWTRMLDCPVLSVDGTRPVDENVEWIVRQMKL
ncbi:MAG: AAA family ATPase [Candidatus Limiplasma sp.]|nr:AAA family ATPase [Candidatus Limiplasma sp.]